MSVSIMRDYYFYIAINFDPTCLRKIYFYAFHFSPPSGLWFFSYSFIAAIISGLNSR